MNVQLLEDPPKVKIKELPGLVIVSLEKVALVTGFRNVPSRAPAVEELLV